MQISPPFCGVANTFPIFINEEIETERAKVICQRLRSWSVTKLGFTLGSVSKYSRYSRLRAPTRRTFGDLRNTHA